MGIGREMSMVSLSLLLHSAAYYTGSLPKISFGNLYPTHPFLVDLINQFGVIISNVLCVGLLAGWRYPESHA